MTARFPTLSAIRPSRRNRLFQFVRFRLSRKLWATYRMRTGPLVRGAMALLLSGIGVFSFAQSAGTAPVTAGKQVVLPSVPTLIQTPSGGKVVSGTAVITTPDANNTVVKQDSNRAVIDWQRFSIPKNYTVTFQQPDAKSVTLNRVVGDDPTWIAGQLKANGSVFLLNTNGVYFSGTAKVDTGSLLVSALSTDVAGFDKAGGLKLDGAGKGGSVVNEGQITVAQGGTIALVGATVGNSGSLTAPGGQVAMVAADRVSVDQIGDGMMKFAVERGVVDALVSNSGAIAAQGGQVQLEGASLSSTLSTVVNQTGTVRANALEQVGGKILLRAQGGDVQQAGTVEANGQGSQGQGGQVRLLGERVGLQAGSVTSASGDAQGGTVLVGGGYQGHGEVQNSSYTQADRGSVVDVSAGAQGKAGTAVLWSDGVTRAAGTIKATGGLSGGQVEVSGKKLLNIKGLDLRNSKGGNLLLDPGDVTICYLCTSTVTDDGFGTYTSPGAATTFLDIQDLDGYLSGNSSVTITTTTGAVAFNFAASWNLPGSSSSMTVNAGAGISFSNGVNISSSSPFNITLNAGTAGSGGVTMSSGSLLNLSGGNLVVNSRGNVAIGNISAGNLSVTNVGAGNLTQVAGLNVSGSTTLQMGSGDITLSNSTNVFGGSVSASGANVNVRDNGALAMGSVTATGDLTLRSTGSLTQSNAFTVGGTTNLTATGGPITLTNAGNSLVGAVTASGTNVSLVDSAALQLGNVTATGTLSASSALGITQASSTALSVGSTSTFTADASHDVVLDKTANTFTGALSLGTVQNATVNATGAVALGAASSVGSLTLQTTGNVTQTGALTTTGNVSLTSTAGSVTLTNAGNSLGGSVAASGTNVSLVDSTALQLGNVTATGTLSATSALGITQASSTALSVGSTSTFTADASHDVVLDKTANTFSGALSLGTVRDATVNGTGAIALATASNVGTLTLQTTGNVTQTGALTTTGNVSVTSTAGNVTLSNAGNSLGGSVAASGANVSLVDSTALQLGNVTATGTLSATSTLGITQASSTALSVGSTSTFTADASHDVVLDKTANTFTGALSLGTVRDATVNATGAVALGAASSVGTLTLQTTGNVTQTGALTTTGNVSLTSTAGDISLTQGSNSLGGSVAASGANVSLVDSTALQLGNVTATGTLSATSTLGITQASSTALSVGSTSTFTANATHDVVLDKTANTFTGALSLGTVRDATVNATGAVALGAASSVGTLTLQTTGNVTQTGALTTTGNVSLTSTAGDISLTQGSNSLGGSVAASGANVSLVDGTALQLGNVTATGTLSATSTLGITQASSTALVVGGGTQLSAGSLSSITLGQSGNQLTGAIGVSSGRDLTVNTGGNLTLGTTSTLRNVTLTATGDIQQNQALTATGNVSATSTAGHVVLSQAGNAVSGNVSASGADVTIANSSALVLATVTATGQLTASSANGITQTAGGSVSAGGLTQLSADATHDITLGNAANSLSGQVNVSSVNHATLRTSGALLLGNITTQGNLQGTSAGSITQAGGTALSVGGTTQLTASGASADVTLGSGNTLTGEVSLTAGRNLSVTSAGALTLGALSAGGQLTLSAGGPITQSAAWAVTGTSTLTATGSDITLSDAGNAMQGAISLTGASATLANTGATVLGNATLTGTLSVTGTGAISQAGGSTLTVQGNGTFSAGAGTDVTLDATGNQFSSLVSVSQGRDATIKNGAALQLGTVSASRNVVLVSVGNLTQSGALSAGGTTSVTATGGQVTLNQGGNALTGAFSATGTSVTLNNSQASVLGNISTGALDVTSTQGVSQSLGTSVTATGAVTITADSSHDVLLNRNNSLSGLVTVTAARDATVNTSGVLQLGSLTASRDATLTAAGQVSQASALTVGRHLSATSTAGAITLQDSANTVGGSLAASGSQVDLRTSGDLQLANVTSTGSFSAQSGGHVTQAVGTQLTITGATALTVDSSHDVLLGNSGNALGSSVSVSQTRDLTLNSGTALQLGATTVSRNAILTAVGDISQSSAWSIGGTTQATSTTGKVLLSQAGNTLTGQVSASGTDVSLRSSGDLLLDQVTAAGALTLQSGGHITQQAGSVLSATGNTTVTTDTSHDVSLDKTANQLVGSVAATGRQVTLGNGLATLLGSVQASQGLTVNSTGSVTQQGVTTLQVGTDLNVQATGGSSSVTLTHANTVGGQVALGAGANVTYSTSGAAQMGAVTAGGNVSLVAGGAVTQSGDWQVAGTTQVQATGADVTLNRAGNQLGGAVTLTGRHLDIRDSSALVLGHVTATGNLTLQAAGISQQNASNFSVAGTSVLSADSTHDISMNQAGNVWGGSVSVTSARDVNLRSSAGLATGAITAQRDLTLTAAGDVSQSGVWSVQGTTTVNAGSGQVSLNQSGNALTGALSITGGAVDVSSTSALLLGQVNATSLQVQASGGVSQQNATALTVSGTTSLTADATHDVLLGQAGNSLTGTITVGTVRDLTLANTGALQLGSLSVNRHLSLSATGAISQSAAWNVGGTSQFTSTSGSVTVDRSDNSLAGAVSLSGTQASVRTSGDLQLGQASLTGALNAQAGGHITQQGGTSLQVGGATTVTTDASHDITLAATGNTLQGEVALQGRAVQLGNSVATQLANVTAAQGLTVNSTGSLTQKTGTALQVGGDFVATASGASADLVLNGSNTLAGGVSLTAGRDLSVTTASALRLDGLQVGRHATLTAGGAVTQGGGWQVTGDTQVQAAGFDISLTRTDNALQGAVAVTGAHVAVNNSSALLLGNVTATQGLDAQSAGGISQRNGTALTVTGDVSATASTTTDVKLDAAANQWTGTVSVSAARDVSLAKQGALNLGPVTASRDVTLQAAGALTQSGALTAGGQTSATSATGLVDLGGSNNQLTGAVSLSGTQVTVKNQQALVLGQVDASGLFTATSTQGITQQGGTRVSALAGSVLAADASHDIVLDQAANVLGAPVSVGAARHVTLNTASALQLGSVSLAGDLALQASGDITQSSALSVTGQTSAQSSAGQVLLTQAGNAFSGNVSASGTRVDLTSASALKLGQVNATGDIHLVSAGSMAQMTGSLSAGGLLTAQSGAGTALTLNASGNQVAGTVALTGGDVTWVAQAATVLGDVRATGAFQAQAQGHLTQQAGTTVQVGGASSLTAAGAGHDLVLDQANVFSQGTAVSAGRDVKVTTGGALLLNGGQVGRDLVIQSAGAVSQSAVLSVAGQTQVTASGQQVSLAMAGNQLQGAVAVQAATLDVATQGNLQLGALSLTGTLGAKASGQISQTAAAQVTGLSTLEAGQDVAMTQSANQFSGGVKVVSARDVALTQQGALNLAGVQASGQLSVNAQGAVSQSAALQVAGATGIQAAGQSVVLTDASNQLQGAVGITAQQAQLRNQGALVLGATQVTGGYSVQGGSTVSQTAGVVVGGALQVNAAQDITLANAGNQFTGAVSMQTAGNLSLANQAATQLALPSVGGNLTLQSGGAVSQQGAWLVNGQTVVHAAGQSVALTDSGNQLRGAASFTAGNVSWNQASGATMGVLDTANFMLTTQGNAQLGTGHVAGNLTVNTQGGVISQASTGTLTVDGLTTLSTAGTGARGAVQLTQASNQFLGGVNLNQTGATQITSGSALALQGDAASLTVRSSNAVTFGNTQVQGALSVDAQGAAIGQQAASTLKVNGASSLKSAGGNITLQAAGNQLLGKVDVQGAQVNLSQDAALALGQVQAGQLNVSSATSLDLGTGRVDGSLTALASQGDLTQQAAGLSVGGAASLQATQGKVTMDSAQNQWQGAVTLNGKATVLRAQGAVTVASATVQGLNLEATGPVSLGQVAVQGDLRVQTQGALVNQLAGAGNQVVVSGTTTVDSQGGAASAGAVQLSQSGNQFGGAVNLKSGTTQVNASGALTLGTLQTGALTVGSQGALNLGQGRVQGDLNAVTQGAAITQAAAGAAALVVDGNANLDAQGATGTAAAITLNQAGNDFKGTVSAKGNPVWLTDANTLKTGAITAGTLNLDSTGDLTLGATQAATVQIVTHGGAVTQSAALKNTTSLAIDTAAKPGLVIKNSATPTAVTGAGAITLTDAGNQLQGALKLSGANMQVSSQGSLLIDSLNLQAGSTASFTAQSTVSTSSAIDLGGASLSLKGQNVALGGALTAAGLSLDVSQPLVLNQNITLSGDLTVRSTGSVTQSAGALGVKGVTTVDATQGDVKLTQAGNDFGTLTLNTQAAQVTDRGGFTLKSSTVNSLDVQSDGLLTLAGATVTGDAKLVSGSLTQTAGPLSVGGQLKVTATGADGMVLTQAGNQLGDLLVTSAGQAQISTDAAVVKADVMQVKGAAVLNTSKATSLSLQAGTFQGQSLSFQYDAGLLKPSGVTLLGGSAIILGPQVTYFRESELGTIYSGVNILDGNITRICLGDGAGLDQCMPPAAASRLLPLISVVIAGEEQVAQRRAAGLGGVLRRLRNNSITLDELKAPLEYRNVPEAKRVNCSKEQAEGQTDQACAR